MEILGDLLIYPCKMLIHVLRRNDVRVHVIYKYPYCTCQHQHVHVQYSIDFSLLSHNPYIVKNECVYNCTVHTCKFTCTYEGMLCKWHPIGHPQTFVSSTPHAYECIIHTQKLTIEEEVKIFKCLKSLNPQNFGSRDFPSLQ